MDKYEDLAKRLEDRHECTAGFGPVMREAAAAIRTLQTERDQDRRDAERYRWLRENAYLNQFWDGYVDASIDEAIDTARLQEKHND